MEIKNIYSKYPNESEQEYPLEHTETKINKDSSIRKIDSDFNTLPRKRNTFNSEKLAIFDEDEIYEESGKEKELMEKGGNGRTSRSQKNVETLKMNRKKYSEMNEMEKEIEVSLTQTYENNHF